MVREEGKGKYKSLGLLTQSLVWKEKEGVGMRNYRFPKMLSTLCNIANKCTLIPGCTYEKFFRWIN